MIFVCWLACLFVLQLLRYVCQQTPSYTRAYLDDSNEYKKYISVFIQVRRIGRAVSGNIEDNRYAPLLSRATPSIASAKAPPRLTDCDPSSRRQRGELGARAQILLFVGRLTCAVLRRLAKVPAGARVRSAGPLLPLPTEDGDAPGGCIAITIHSASIHS